jgi:hypothetical protein
MSSIEADDVGALVVSDDGTTIGGIISAADIVRGLKTFGRDVVDLAIGDLMTRDVELMDLHQIRHVPIVRRGSAASSACWTWSSTASTRSRRRPRR